MRMSLLSLAMLLGALAVIVSLPSLAFAQEDPQPLVTALPPSNMQTIVVTPDPWKDLGTARYGHNYQVYIPKSIASDNPEALRTYNPAGYPRNGQQQTPEGNSCATDADCKVPLGCFSRADSGALPVRVCAFPPAY